jgi:hypothetical protein
MTHKKFNLTHRSTIITSKIGPQPTKLFRRVMTLGILIGALAFSISERSTVKVKADDCSSVWFSLEVCHYDCADVSPFSSRVGCFGNCQFTHALAGATCNMPSYSPMMVTGGGCDPAANGQRAYDNCMAGTLDGFWQDEYLNLMAYYNDMWVACATVGQHVEAQGCY